MTDHAAQANIEVDAAGLAPDGRLLVFAYGSLIWKPAFDYVAKWPATIFGYHRDFCVHSTVHRGTPDRTGLVLGLAPGGACRGMVFEVTANDAHEAIAALDARELVTDVYQVAQVQARQGAFIAPARTYRCDLAHEEYAGCLTVEEMAVRIVGAEGDQGPNEDYLFNTVEALRGMGLRDARLEALYDRVNALMAQ